MIRIDFSLAVALYLLLTLGLIVGLWFIFEQRIKAKGSLGQRKNVWHCSVCTYTYLDTETDLSICPRCKSYNRREGTVERKEKG